MTWVPVERWEVEQPMRCMVCESVYVGRELGYCPAMCEREGCPGPGRRRVVAVVPDEDHGSTL